jgi:glycosyltransferase involved in cell wall biosynthesis
VVIDTFHPWEISEHRTGGPKFLRENLTDLIDINNFEVTHLGKFYTLTRISKCPNLAQFFFGRKIKKSTILRTFTVLRTIKPSSILLSSEHPKISIPALFYCIFNKEVLLSVPIMHLSVRVRRGFFINSINWGYVWQRLFFILLKLIKKKDFFTINKKTTAYLELLFQDSTTVQITPKTMINKSNYNQIDLNKTINLNFIGRISPQKGVFDLVKVAKRLNKELSIDWVINIIGHGSKKQTFKLAMLIRILKLRKLKLYTNFKNEMLLFSPIFENSIFLMPSYEEGFSYAISENINMQKIVICWKIEELTEHWSRYKNVILVEDIGNTKEFSRTIKEVIYSKVSDQND